MESYPHDALARWFTDGWRAQCKCGYVGQWHTRAARANTDAVTHNRNAATIHIEDPCDSCSHGRAGHAFLPNGEPAPLCIDHDYRYGDTDSQCECEGFEALAAAPTD